jgi:hypothetical protein
MDLTYVILIVCFIVAWYAAKPVSIIVSGLISYFSAPKKAPKRRLM